MKDRAEASQLGGPSSRGRRILGTSMGGFHLMITCSLKTGLLNCCYWYILSHGAVLLFTYAHAILSKLANGLPAEVDSVKAYLRFP